MVSYSKFTNTEKEIKTIKEASTFAKISCKSKEDLKRLTKIKLLRYCEQKKTLTIIHLDIKTHTKY